VVLFSTGALCGADYTKKTTSQFKHHTRGVLRIASLIGIRYRPERHSLPTVPYTGLIGASPVSTTGSPNRRTSVSSPQTSSNVRVRAGPSSPVEGSVTTTKHGP
jgi:hypothetical protein